MAMPRSAAAFLYGRRGFYLALLLLPPLLWLGIIYLGSLFALLVQSFYAIDEFTARIVPVLTLATYRQLFSHPANLDIILRTVAMAAAVTAAAAVIAFPVANYMARYATPRMKAFFYVGVMLPMWTSYLVKVYAWRLILSDGGVLNAVLEPLGLKGPGYSDAAVWLVESYLWLPYMIIPVFAGFERIPGSLLEASADLGGRAGMTLRRVILPLALPAIAAGSIFTFSLTLGDYITPTLVSNTRFIGNVVYDFVGIAGNQPLAAAFAMVPVTIMLIFLLVARRLGAFEAL